MAKKDQLSPLINSLTPAEKKYFVQYSSVRSDNKSYMKLYDCVVRDRKFDASKLSMELKKNKANLAHEKEYLTENILHALVNYHKEGTVDAQLNHLLALTDVSFNKGVFEKCRSLIEKGKRLALLHEKYQELLCFYRREIYLVTKLNIRKGEIEKLLEQSALAAQRAGTAVELSLFGMKFQNILIGCSFRPGARDKTGLGEIMATMEMHKAKYRGSFAAECKYLEISRNYQFLVTGNRQKLLEIGEEMVKLYENNLHITAIQPWNYITSLLANVIIYNEHGLTGKSVQLVAKAKAALRLYRDKLGETSYGVLFTGYIKCRLSTLIYTGKYTAAIVEARKYENEYLAYATAGRETDIINFYYYNAMAHIFVNRADAGLDMLQKVLLKIDKDSNKIMRFRVYMLEIIAQYQHGNHILVPSLLQSLLRWCKMHTYQTTGAFKIFTVMMRALSSQACNKRRQRNTFQIYQKQFSDYFTQHASQSQLLEGQIDMDAWIALQLGRI